MPKLNVYGGSVKHPVIHKQVRALVAATSRQKAIAAMEAVGIRMTLCQMVNYWHSPGNTDEISLATSSPGTVFVTEGTNYDKAGTTYKPLKETP